MTTPTWTIVTVAMSGLLAASGARAEAAARFEPEQVVEVCEALPWDVPLEQAVATNADGHWRRAGQDAPPADRPRRQGVSVWRHR